MREASSNDQVLSACGSQGKWQLRKHAARLAGSLVLITCRIFTAIPRRRRFLYSVLHCEHDPTCSGTKAQCQFIEQHLTELLCSFSRTLVERPVCPTSTMEATLACQWCLLFALVKACEANAEQVYLMCWSPLRAGALR